MFLKPRFNTFSKIKVLLSALIFLTFSCGNGPAEIPEQYHDFCSHIHRNNSVSLSEQLKPFDTLMQHQTGVFVLEDGGTSMMARAWFSEYAEKTIDVQYFIFSTDNVGLIACDYLVRAADRGVKVRILIDDIMVDAGIHEILTLNSHPNIDIKVYNPGTNLGKNLAQKLTRFATDFNRANQRMHNKTFTVDGKIVITGGRNIADEYFDYDHEYNFRDRDVLFLGKEVSKVQSSFNTFWQSNLSVDVTELVSEKENTFTDSNRFERLHQYACNPNNFWPQVRERINNMPQTIQKLHENGAITWVDSISFVTDLPGKKIDSSTTVFSQSTRSLIELVMKAKKSVFIQSPYLIVTDVGLNLLKNAIKRSVEVKILTNSMSSTDNMEAFSGYQRCRKQLLEAGVQIYEFKPDAAIRYKVMTGALQEKMNFTPIFGLHAKSMVIDGNISVIGTFNFDPRSAYYNTECVTIVHSNKVAQGVLKGMEEEIKPENAWHTTLSYNPDALATKSKRTNAYIKKIVPKGIL
ncbi:MAG: phospholipase D family protein [Bacteroidetes bacterium B1(2017)]|nr:MAG: phospholipase D family protein [Bacteroidetes bacterium B1(2017)]